MNLKNQSFIYTFLTFFLAFFLSFNVHADFVQDNNNGFFGVDFLSSSQGYLTGAPSANFTSNFAGGFVQGSPNGQVLTAEIRPTSFQQWRSIDLGFNASAAGDVVVEVYDCADTPGVSAPLITQNLPGVIDVTSLNSPTKVECIDLLLIMNNSSFVSNLEVRWKPLPVYQLNLGGITSQAVGANLAYRISYALNFVDDEDVVIYLPLPSDINGTVSNQTVAYGQNVNPSFVSATNGGEFAGTAITVAGVNIPANSVYWVFDDIVSGETGNLNFVIASSNGLEDDIRYRLQAFVDSALVDETASNVRETRLQSNPSPRIRKEVFGAVTTDNATPSERNIVTNAGTFTGVVEYQVWIGNDVQYPGVGRPNTTGVETVFNPIIVDDISDIIAKLEASDLAGDGCGVADAATQITVQNGGIIDTVAGTIQWTVNDLGVGGFSAVRYQVDYTPCIDNGTFGAGDISIDSFIDNVATFNADNISPISDDERVEFEIEIVGNGSIAKGDRVRNSSEISGNRDDNNQGNRFRQFRGERYSYLMRIANSGVIRLDDNVVVDMVPVGTNFISATLPANVTNGEIYYATGSASGSSDPLLPPAFFLDPNNPSTANLEFFWSATVPSYDPSTEVLWVAFYVPCLDSPLLSVDSAETGGAITECDGVGSQAVFEIETEIRDDIFGDICGRGDLINTAHFTSYSAGDDILANDAQVSTLADPLTSRDSEPTHVFPDIAIFDSAKAIQGDSVVNANSVANYTIRLVNNGNDASLDTRLVVSNPILNIDGNPETISVVSFSGGTLVNPDLSSQLELNVGTIPAGSSREVEVSYFVPAGLFNNESFTLTARISGTDDLACAGISSTQTFSTSVIATAIIEVVKERNEALIGSGGTIHYQLNFQNIGVEPTNRTFVVDRIPNRTVFEEAYTSPFVDGNSNSFNCADCQVYLADSNANLPAELSPFDPLTPNDILANFQLAVEIEPGRWVPPVGMNAEDVKYLAYRVDNTTPDSTIFEVGLIGSVGYLVTNDEGGGVGSTNGTVITNAAAILADQLVQAIGNQVSTTVLDDPGLFLNKTVNSNIVPASSDVEYEIAYFNSSEAPDTSVVLTDTVPANLDFISVEHQWNAEALSNGVLPAGRISIPVGDPNLTVTTNVDGTTTVELNVTGLRPGNLQIKEGGSLFLNTRVKDNIPSGTTIINSVEGCFENANNSLCVNDEEPIFIRNPNLVVRKLSGNSSPSAGQTISQVLSIGNIGFVSALGTVITDTLPEGVAYVPSSTLVLTSPYTVSEPSITNVTCLVGSGTCQQLVWNDLDNGTDGVGVVPADSANVLLQYDIVIPATASAGDSFNNAVSISTTSGEDPDDPSDPSCADDPTEPDCANDTDVTVQVPYPDPYIVKSAPSSVSLQDSFSYFLTYGNNTVTAASDVYFIDSLPDVSFQSVSGSGEQIFCSTTLTNVTSLADPTLDGWVDCSTLSGVNNVNVLVVVGALPSLAGPNTVSIAVRAAGASIGVGSSFTNSATIYSENTDQLCEGDVEDADCGNNASSATTRIPGFDLFIEKTGSAEGSFPGISPGSALSYTINFGNRGTDPACGIQITDGAVNTSIDGNAVTALPFPSDVTPSSSVDNFTNLILVDDSGEVVSALTEVAAGSFATLTDPVTVTRTGDETAGYTYTLGDVNTCIPGDSNGSFTIFTVINSDVADGTVVENEVVITDRDTDFGTAEELNEENNRDRTFVNVFRADLLTFKDGTYCGPDNNCATEADNDPLIAEPASIINYEIQYNNIGNIDAEDVILTETIPEGTCYRIGTIEANQPPNTTIEYSNDNGLSWTHTPVADSNGVSCDTTNFRLVFNSPVPAPATFFGQNLASEFETNTNSSNLRTGSGRIGILRQGVNLSTGSVDIDGNPISVGAEVGTGGSFASGGIIERTGSNSSDSRTRLTTDSNGNAHQAFIEVNSSTGTRDVIYYNGETDTYLDITQIAENDSGAGFVAGVAPFSAERSNIGIPGLLIDDSNAPHIVWVQYNNSSAGTDILYYNGATGAVTNLSDQAEIDTAGGFVDSGFAIPSTSSAKFDPAGNIHIAWTERDVSNVDALYFNGITGQVISLSDSIEASGSSLSDNGNVVQGPMIEFNSSGVPYLTWTEPNGSGVGTDALLFSPGAPGANLTQLTAADVSAAFVDAGDPLISGIFSANDGRVYVVYVEPNGAVSNRDAILHELTTNTILNISAEATATVAGLTTENTALVISRIDSLGNIHVLVREGNTDTSSNDLYLYSNNGSGVTHLSGLASGLASFTDSGNVAGINFVLFELDNSNTPHVLWREANTSNNGDMLYYDGANVNHLSNFAAALSSFTDSGSAFLATSRDLRISPSNNVCLAWQESNTVGGEDAFFFNSITSTVVHLSDAAIQQGNALTNNVSNIRCGEDFVFWIESTTSGLDELFVYEISTGEVEKLSTEFANDAFQTFNFEGEDYLYFFEGGTDAYDYDVTKKYWSKELGVFDSGFGILPGYYGPYTENLDDALGGSYFSSSPFGTDIFYGSLDEFSLFGAHSRAQTETTNIVPECGSGSALNWGRVFFDVEVPNGTALEIDILDSTGAVIPGFANIVNTDNFFDISSLPASDPIRLRAKFIPDESLPPLNVERLRKSAALSLNSWNVTYTCDTIPSFHFEVRVLDASALTTSTIFNNVSIETSTPEIETANNNDQDTLLIPTADLAVNKLVDLAVAKAGDPLNISLEVCNQGPQEAMNILIQDTYPAQINYIAASPIAIVSENGASYSCTNGAGELSCLSNTSLASGACDIIELNGLFEIDAGTVEDPATTLLNNACVENDTFDPDSSNNCDSATTIVDDDDFINLFLDKEGPSPFVNLGDEVSYRFTYGNNGNLVANNVVINDAFTSTAQLDASFATTFSYSNVTGVTPDCTSPALGIIRCERDNLGNPITLNSGDGGEIVATVRVSATNLNLLTTPTGVANTATIESCTVPLTIGNDCSVANIASEINISDNFDNWEAPIAQGALSSLAGQVFVDDNGDVRFDAGGDDSVIQGVAIHFYGVDIFGNIYGPDPALYARGDAAFDAIFDQIFSELSAGIILPSALGTVSTTATSIADLINDPDYQAVSSMLTDSSGAYSFLGLTPGTYNLAQQQPVGYLSTGSNGGQVISPLLAPPGFIDTTSRSTGHGIGSIEGGGVANFIREIELLEGTDSLFNDFGESLGSIGDLIFSDRNNDGIYNPADGDQPIAGVEVSLFRDVNLNGVYDVGTDTFEQSITSDSLGSYSFDNLLLDDGSGSYPYIVVVTDSIGVLQGAGNVLGPDQGTAATSNNNSKNADGFAITLDAATTDVEVADFGFVGEASLGNYVWFDTNQNGVQDGNEPGVAAITVNLLDVNGVQVETTATDGSGFYEFDELAPGTYSVEFVATGYQFTVQDAALATDILDSDANAVTGITQQVLLQADDANNTLDAGLFATGIEPASIGDFVFYDIDNDGVQDTAETGVGGVTVSLLNNLSTVIATSITDPNGFYQFNGLLPGSYSVSFSNPSGYNFSPTNVGSDSTDSDADSITGSTPSFTLLSGESNNTVDAGLFSPAGVASIGDFVWLDLDGDGVQDSGETGVAGVVVELLDSIGGVLQTTMTDTAGSYSFSNLLPGDYQVRFDISSAYGVTIANQGSDNLDSDIGILDTVTPLFTLAAGVNNFSLDAGLTLPYSPSEIGNRVFNDLNGDGLQTSGEPGIPGVLVQLIDGNGDVFASTTSSATGNYLFSNLASGNYRVRFVDQTASTVVTTQGGAPLNDTDSDAGQSSGLTPVVVLGQSESNLTIDAGFVMPTQVGDFVWFDENRDGIQDPSEGGLPGIVVNLYTDAGILVASTLTGSNGNYSFTDLAPGDYQIEVVPPSGLSFSPQNVGSSVSDSDIDSTINRTAVFTLVAGDSNTTIDAGLFSVISDSATDVSVTKIGSETQAVRGGLLSYTLVVRNEGSITSEGVVLYDPTPADLVLQSVSAPCGSGFPCVIGDLVVGESRSISVSYLVPDDYIAPDPIVNVATVTSETPDSNPDNNESTSSTPVDDEALSNLSVVKTGPPSAMAGSTVTFELLVSNSGPHDAREVELVDSTPIGLVFQSATAPCAGGFPCDLGILNAGDSRVVEVTFDVPVGYTGSDPIVNIASVSSVTPDSDPSDNMSTAEVPLGADPVDLVLTKTGPAILSALGDNISYEIKILNKGPATATGVTLTDPTPTGLTFISASSGCNGGFPCGLSDIPAGESRTVFVTYNVPSDYTASDAIINTASVDSNEPDADTSDNSDSASTGVVNELADVEVQKLAPANLIPGMDATYSIIVTNNGPGMALDVVLDDPPSADLTYVLASAPCEGGFPCSLGDINSGATIVVNVVFNVNPNTISVSISNVATVSSPSIDTNGDNNEDSASAPVGLNNNCIPELLDENKLLIDGFGIRMLNLVRQADSTDRVTTKNLNCSRTDSDLRTRIFARADALYNELWEEVWLQIPANNFVCETQPPQCSEFDLRDSRRFINSTARTLGRQIDRMLGDECSRLSRRGATLLRRTERLRNRIRRRVRRFPDPILSCEAS